MKSKLLQKKRYGRNRSREVVDDEQESTERFVRSYHGRSARTHLVESPATGAQARKDFPVS
jgi:hypothetical protein